MSDAAVSAHDALQLRAHGAGEASRLRVLRSWEVDRQWEQPGPAAMSAPNRQRLVRPFHARYFATAPPARAVLPAPADNAPRRPRPDQSGQVELGDDLVTILPAYGAGLAGSRNADHGRWRSCASIAHCKVSRT